MQPLHGIFKVYARSTTRKSLTPTAAVAWLAKVKVPTKEGGYFTTSLSFENRTTIAVQWREHACNSLACSSTEAVGSFSAQGNFPDETYHLDGKLFNACLNRSSQTRLIVAKSFLQCNFTTCTLLDSRLRESSFTTFGSTKIETRL